AGRYRPARLHVERFALTRRCQQLGVEARGLGAGAEHLLPRPVTILPPDAVTGDRGALVLLRFPHADVVRRGHHSVSSHAASQRSYSSRRIRSSPFGSLTHFGARFLA